jgi:VanZ family protein
MFLRYWLPPVLWMGILFIGSGALLSEPETSRIIVPLLKTIFPGAPSETLRLLHFLIRKLAHLTEYAILALLWYRAFFRGRVWSPTRSAALALVISVAYAILDEFHQSLTGVRTGSPGDVHLDASGAALALSVPVWGWTVTLERLTGLFLWMASLGGGIMLLVDLWVGVPPGWLWFTTPAALTILVGRRRFGFLSSRKSA